MTDDHDFERLEALLEELLELDADGREARLADIAAEDETLASELERLLAAEESGDLRTLEGTLGAETDGARSTGERGRPSLSRYRVLQKIGEGGFGTVWLAEQTEPVRRQVAVKVLKPGLDSGQVLARFEAERQALALMDHPNIAKVLDAGSDDLGRPFVVMELVRGIAIGEYCRDRDLDLDARLRMARDVASAVQHAHTKGVIHRDLKPANILVGEVDGRPVPKVIDFGVAKAMQAPLTDRTLFTEFRQFVGTPEYMSPEQAELSIVDVDARSDVYSLGVLLYELVTGSPPFDPETLRGSGFDEMRRIIREVEPPMPSTRATALASSDRPGVESHRIGRVGGLVRGELDWIIMKAMAKARDRRYATAAELAADLGRLLAGEPVEAAPPSRIYRMRRFAGRHRAGVGIAATVALATVSVAAASSFGWKAATDRNDALAAAERAEQEKREAAESRADELATAVAARDAAVSRLEGDLAIRRVALASELRASDGTLARAYLDAVPADRMPWLGRTLDSMLPVITPEADPTGPSGVVLGVSADTRRAVTLQSVEDGFRVMLRTAGGADVPLSGAGVDPDEVERSEIDGGTLVHFGVGDGPVAIAGRLLAGQDEPASPTASDLVDLAAAVADGSKAAAAQALVRVLQRSRRGTSVLVVDPKTGDRRMVAAPGGEVLHWDLSPDGRTVAVMGPEGVQVATMGGGEWTLDWPLETDRYRELLVAVDDDGTIAVACSGHLSSPEESKEFHGWIRVFREGVHRYEDILNVRSILRVTALDIDGDAVAAVLDRATFVVVPFGTPRSTLAVSRRIREAESDEVPSAGRVSSLTTLEEAVRSRSGVGVNPLVGPEAERGRVSLSSNGRFAAVVARGGSAALVDAISGEVVCAFSAPQDAFGLTALDDGRVSGWSLAAVDAEGPRRWASIESRSGVATTRSMPRGGETVRYQDPFGAGSVMLDGETLVWATDDARIRLDATPALIDAVAEPDDQPVRWCVIDGGRRLIAVAAAIEDIMQGAARPFLESWNLATGERLSRQDLQDGDRLLVPVAIVAAGDGAVVSGVAIEATDPENSLDAQMSLLLTNGGVGADLRSALVDGLGGAVSFRTGHRIVAGEVTLPDGATVTLECDLDLTRPGLRVHTPDGRTREVGLPFEIGDVASGDPRRDGPASRLIVLDEGRTVAVLGERLVVLDTVEWLPLGSIAPELLAGETIADWNAIRGTADGGIELSGVTDDGVVTVTVPGSTPASRPPAAGPTS